MKIPSKDIPQADTFESVLRTVEGVAHGVTTSQAMAANLGLNDRQGRYYRRAAEILGFVHNVPGRNDSVLTPAGQRFVRADPAERAKMATDAVLNARSIQRVIPFLESKGPRGATRREIEQFITTVAEPTTPDMIHRRLSSIVSWLSAIGILEENEGRISIGGNLPADIPPVKYNAIDEPLSPQHYDLQTY